MDFLTLIAIMAIIGVFMAWYANSSKRNKIYCTFRRVNKTKIEKFARMSSRYVIFDGGKYDIIPSRISFVWWNKGLINQLFPQWVATLDYSWFSRFPHDPNKMEVTAETPKTRKALNKEEWVESYYKGAKPSAANKQNIIAQYLPWVAIGLVVIVAFYFHTKMSGFGAQLDAVINNLNAITR